MKQFAVPAVMQCGLVAALFAILLWALLVPVAHGQTLAPGGVALVGTPSSDGTPIPERPAPAATAPSAPGAPEATPIVPLSTPTLPGVPLTPTQTPTPTPTVVAGGTVRAEIVRPLDPLLFTLSGRDQLATATMVVEVRDSASVAEGRGWQLVMTIEPFAIADRPSRMLPHDAVTLMGVAIACAPEAECRSSGDPPSLPLAMPAGSSTPIYRVAGEGTGVYRLTLTVAVHVPGNAYAGSYQTNVAVVAVR